jgi:hypothetical protein
MFTKLGAKAVEQRTTHTIGVGRNTRGPRLVQQEVDFAILGLAAQDYALFGFILGELSDEARAECVLQFGIRVRHQPKLFAHVRCQGECPLRRTIRIERRVGRDRNANAFETRGSTAYDDKGQQQNRARQHNRSQKLSIEVLSNTIRQAVNQAGEQSV